ncbi:MAG: helix-turn-helix domain-containing protein [Granulosicoccus sp.]|nr:helix-turn-helix domain-containing protein [Granulosicoccus sp.]
MESDDWDWDFDEDDNQIRVYDSQSNDLSEEINSGYRVRDLRELEGISVNEFSQECGISAADLMAIEAGMLKLDHQTAQLAARALGVNLSYIWDE